MGAFNGIGDVLEARVMNTEQFYTKMDSIHYDGLQILLRKYNEWLRFHCPWPTSNHFTCEDFGRYSKEELSWIISGYLKVEFSLILVELISLIVAIYKVLTLFFFHFSTMSENVLGCLPRSIPGIINYTFVLSWFLLDVSATE